MEASGGERPRPLPVALFHSLEYRNRLVSSLYQNFLGQAAAPEEIAFYADLLGKGLRQEDVIRSFLASDEYFNKP